MKPELNSSRLNLWRESLNYSLLGIISSVLAILTLAVLTRGYSVAEIGLYFFLTANIRLLGNIHAGVGRALEKRLSERNTGHLQFYTISLVVCIGVPIILLAITAFLHLTVLPISLGEITISWVTLSVIAIGVIGRGGKKMGLSYLSGIGRPTLSKIYDTAFDRLSALLIVSVIVGFYSGTSIETVFVLTNITGVLTLILAIFSTETGKRDSILPSKTEVKRLAKFAKWSVPNDILNDLYHRMDVFYLAFFLTATTIGYYESSVRLMSIMFAFPNGVSRVITVKMSGMYEEGIAYHDMFSDAHKKLLGLLVVFLIIVILFGKQMLSFAFGAEYTPAYIYFVGVTAQLILQSSRLMYESLFNATDNPHLITRISLTTVILNAILAPPFILWLGGLGMIISTMICEIVRTGAFYRMSESRLKND